MIEHEVLRYLVRGYSFAEMARSLGLAVFEVERIRESICKKLTCAPARSCTSTWSRWVLWGQKGTTGIPPLSDSRNLASLLLERYPMWFYPRKGMAEKRLQERLAELNERLSYLQARNNPADAEEFIRLYQERRELLKELGNAAAKISAS